MDDTCLGDGLGTVQRLGRLLAVNDLEPSLDGVRKSAAGLEVGQCAVRELGRVDVDGQVHDVDGTASEAILLLDMEHDCGGHRD